MPNCRLHATFKSVFRNKQPKIDNEHCSGAKYYLTVQSAKASRYETSLSSPHGSSLHPSSSSFSWTRWDGTRASRIDLCGILYVWVSSVLSCDLHPCPFSDHCGLLTVVSVPDVVPPGPGLWKLNTSILQEQAYVLLISDFWASWRSSVPRFTSLAKWWDEGKKCIKGLSIRYCCSRSGARSCNRDLLVRLVDRLKSKVDAGSMSCLGPYHSALSELAILDSEAARGAQGCARVRWVEEGEILSSYFFRLEKWSSDHWISALRESDGSIVSSPADLCRSLSSFYSGLFTASGTDPCAQSALLGNLSSFLPGDQAALCEGHLSVKEVSTALLGMARRKAPGLDGLPVEFYVKFFSCFRLKFLSRFGFPCSFSAQRHHLVVF